MADTDPDQLRLDRLRQWRVRPEPDRSSRFILEQFRKEIERPYKQLRSLSTLWQELVPADLVQHTRLERLQRGVLHVGVDDSSHLYELDRLLRSGLKRELITRHRGPALRQIKLRVAPLDPSGDAGP